MIYEDPLALIGKTPVVCFSKTERGAIFLKLETANPTGSTIDRVALTLIEDLLARKLIDAKTELVEATSSNSGPSLAFICACYHLPLTLFMPENVDPQLPLLARAYGAKVILTPKERGLSGAISKARASEKQEGFFHVDLSNSRLGPIAHMRTTALEILSDFPEGLDYLLIAASDCALLVGLSRVLKEKMKDLHVIAVEPKESAVLSGGRRTRHGVKGLGLGSVPPFFEKEAVDGIITVSLREAKEEAKELIQRGLLLGLSSAALVYAAKEIIRRDESARILVIAPDGGPIGLMKEQ